MLRYQNCTTPGSTISTKPMIAAQGKRRTSPTVKALTHPKIFTTSLDSKSFTMPATGIQGINQGLFMLAMAIFGDLVAAIK